MIPVVPSKILRFRTGLAAASLIAGLAALPTASFASGISSPSSKKVPSRRKKARLNVVKSVTTETDDNSSIISVFLERTPSWQQPKVSYQKNFVQVELNGVTVLEPGKSYPSKSPHFKKIIPYQIKPGLSALRIYLAKPAADYKKALSCDILGERLLVYLDHSFIAAPAAKAVREERLSKEVAEVIATTKVNRSIPDPAKQMKVGSVAKAVKNTASTMAKPAADTFNYSMAAPKAEPKVAPKKAPTVVAKTEAKATPAPQTKGAEPSAEAEGFYTKLHDKMKTVAFVTIGLLLLLGAVHLYRKRKGAAGGLAVQTPHGTLAIPSLKPLASYAIGPKQKLTLIGMHNKMILLGVSSDNIQYLYATEDANDPELSQKISEGLGGTTLQGRQAQSGFSAPRASVSSSPTPAPRVESAPRAAAPRAAAHTARAAQQNVSRPAKASNPGFKAYTQRGGQQDAQPRVGAVNAEPRRAGAAAQTRATQQPRATQPEAQTPRQGASHVDPEVASHGNAGQQAPRQAIEDVTSLIRKKLKDLPSI